MLKALCSMYTTVLLLIETVHVVYFSDSAKHTVRKLKFSPMSVVLCQTAELPIAVTIGVALLIIGSGASPKNTCTCLRRTANVYAPHGLPPYSFHNINSTDNDAFNAVFQTALSVYPMDLVSFLTIIISSLCSPVIVSALA